MRGRGGGIGRSLYPSAAFFLSLTDRPNDIYDRPDRHRTVLPALSTFLTRSAGQALGGHVPLNMVPPTR